MSSKIFFLEYRPKNLYTDQILAGSILHHNREQMRGEMSMDGIYATLPYFQATKLLLCLSSESLCRWCTYEWFYSAVDYPWFMNNEFVNYLNYAKLRYLSWLTRSEWKTIQRY
ncbi:hypothetical protein QYE76_065462 [Lolium multiflorum]|uniref:DIRP domain-containing protein n=1 Tax=Lolium multiflorum TaxID=4521 RepID=A0AAD8WB85_LOLMU|nr:hypothetical protein QYE76_065462 [Lolium multiflorum]